MELLELLELLYAPIQLIVWHPERALLVAALFFALMAIAVYLNKYKGKEVRLLPISIAFLVWVLLGINEYFAHAYRWDIRVDLVLYWPVALGISIFALIVFIRDLGNI